MKEAVATGKNLTGERVVLFLLEGANLKKKYKHEHLADMINDIVASSGWKGLIDT